MKLEELNRIIELSCNDDKNDILVVLIINLYMGGKIIMCNTDKGIYYYNLLNGKDINGIEVSSEFLLGDEETRERYLELLKVVKFNFSKYGNKEYKLLDENGNFFISKIPGTIGGYKKLKIYGKMDCPSALNYINKGFYVNNRVFFLDEETAIKNGYRPCGKCMKKEYNIWKLKNIKQT